MIRAGLALVLIASGWASSYGPGVFERTVQKQTENGHLPENSSCKGGCIALLDSDLMGQYVMVCKDDDCRWMLVADCAGVEDGGYAWMVNGNIAGEIDYESTRDWGIRGYKIRVYLPVHRYLFD